MKVKMKVLFTFTFTLLVFFLDGAWANLCVSVPKAVLRESPQKDAKISWVVGKFMPLKEISRSKGWVQVSDMDGKPHWVLASQVQRARTGFRCLVIRSDFVMARSGPGKGFDPVEMGLMDKYTPAEDLSGEEGWTRIRNDLGQAWVPLSATWKPTEIIHLNY